MGLSQAGRTHWLLRCCCALPPPPSTRGVVVVVVVVGCENLLSQLLLAFVDICVQLVSILANRELLIIVNRDVDSTSADWLVIWVVELGYIWMTQGCLCCQTSAWVEL